MEQIRDTKSAKNRIHSLYFQFAAKIWTLLRTRVAQFPCILPVFAKVDMFRNIASQGINLGKVNMRYTDRAYLPVTIWVYLCGGMFYETVREQIIILIKKCVIEITI